MPEPVTAAVAATAGANLIGGKLSSDAASSANKKATAAQRQSAQDQLDFQKQMYNQSREDFTPYRDLGSFATQRLGQRLGMPSTWGTKASGVASADTLYNTPQGLVNVPYGSTLMNNSGGTLVGATTPQGGNIDLSRASVYTAPTPSGTKTLTAADLFKKYGLTDAVKNIKGVNTRTPSLGGINIPQSGYDPLNSNEGGA